MEVTSIAVKLIRPSAKQPKDRTKDVAALAASVKAIGIIQPIHVVEKAGRFQGSGERYEIVAGHRRWAAAKVAGLEMIPAIVLDLDKTSQQVIRMTENVHRRQLTSMEEAMAIEVLLKMHRSYDEIAADLAMSATTVARRARLLSLIPKWRKLIDELPASSLELVARYDNKRQEALYDRFNGYLPETDRLKAILAEADHRLSSAPWKQDDEALFPKAGSCAKCEKRSDCQALLFHEDDGAKAAKTARCRRSSPGAGTNLRRNRIQCSRFRHSTPAVRLKVRSGPISSSGPRRLIRVRSPRSSWMDRRPAMSCTSR
jgi:ParB/RepB/Spo0J family partition protein